MGWDDNYAALLRDFENILTFVETKISLDEIDKIIASSVALTYYNGDATKFKAEL